MQPPASLKALGDPIYETFYGLTEQPFAITTDPRFFYLSASHQRAFTELLNGLRRRESLLMLTGETGSGKTTLCRAVLAALGDRTFSAIILNPYMTGAEVLRIVLRDFGLVSHEDLRRGGLAAADVPQLLDTLEGFLRSLVPLGSHAVIVLDEAQSLVPAALDQIRLLTGLEYEGKRLVQVVLCGQPGLLQTIKADALLALNERITRRVELAALPADEIRGYIQHRLGVAGGLDAVRFDTAATQVVADLSRGLPRRINVLCDRALQEGRIEGVNIITADLVKRAARALAGVHDPMPLLQPEPARPTPSVVSPPAAPVAVTPPPPPPAQAAPPLTPPAPPEPTPVWAPIAPPVVARDNEERGETPVDTPLDPPVDRVASVEPESVSWPAETPAPAPSEFLPERVAPSTSTTSSMRELSFGQEKPRKAWTARLAGMVAVAAIASTLGYAAWAWDVRYVRLDDPAQPPLDRGAPPAEIPMPPLNEIPAMFPIRRYVPPPPQDPVVDTPPEAAFPVPDVSIPSDQPPGGVPLN